MRNKIIVDGIAYVPKQQTQSDDVVMVRTRSAGVFYGTLVNFKGQAGRVLNARRVWYWDGASSLSELATLGPARPKTCKFPVPVEWVDLTDIIEVLPVTVDALAKLDAVEVWSQHG